MSSCNDDFQDLVKMISAERDARRAAITRLDGRIDIIQKEVGAIREEIWEGHERTSGFESAMIDVLGRTYLSHENNQDRLDILEIRVSDLEKRQGDAAS
ncbi:MAG: hypothetical protein FJZ00_07030 [Candidatus Sericytochromatia bacterium]|uniref:Uncharacterized protein n=1 Tax=Candidatus Tanganyikabacteria bacterium TaxID=2961651 RepID=A0A937X406_9BACT|nr:hypothetical protein [Candidatus Tanganyikabacteria bacterium]